MFLPTILLLTLGLQLFVTPSAQAQPTSDEFILGFATALVRHEFKAPDSLVEVQDGIVTVSARSLTEPDREKLMRALGGIPGVREVVVHREEEAPTPLAPEKAIKEDTPESKSSFLSRGLLFAPIHADPRWPHFSATYRGYRTNDLTAAFAGNFGETFSIYRHRAPLNGQWEFVVQAGVFSLFDLSATSLDLVNADYIVGILTTYRSGNFSGLLRLHHQSSHLGDEFLLSNQGVRRINLSYEEVDMKLSYELLGWTRIYGGGGYLAHRDPVDLRPISTQWGVEVTSPRSFWGGAIRPVVYADFQANERASWTIAQSLMVGVRFENARIGNRQLQLLAEYFSGPAPDGQFYLRHAQWFGAGLRFYF